MTEQLLIGLLPGTSRDGVDAVLVNSRNDKMELLHASCTPYPVAIRQTLDQLLETGAPPEPAIAGLLDENLGRFFARVAQNLTREAGMEMRDISAIGSHGQNLWHQPGAESPFSLQVGNGPLMAKNTGTAVVCNFRSADIEAGGQGAPLAPLLHRYMFHSDTENRAVLNIGGIANLTLLPADGDISGFDCGPGNCLMDGWAMRYLNKEYDNRGDWARKGTIDNGLLNQLLEDAYFKLPAPNSSALEYFNLNRLENVLERFSAQPSDVQATLSELTARSVAISLDKYRTPDRLLVCGGGAHNTHLLRRLAAALPDTVVETTSRFGAEPDWVEGMLFAWLAKQRLEESYQDTRLITGAQRPVLLGEIYRPPVHARQ